MRKIEREGDVRKIEREGDVPAGYSGVGRELAWTVDALGVIDVLEQRGQHDAHGIGLHGKKRYWLPGWVLEVGVLLADAPLGAAADRGPGQRAPVERLPGYQHGTSSLTRGDTGADYDLAFVYGATSEEAREALLTAGRGGSAAARGCAASCTRARPAWP